MEKEPHASTSRDTLPWILIGVGVLAAALALWDLLVERDGGTGGSLAALATGALVIGLGIQRRRR